MIYWSVVFWVLAMLNFIWMQSDTHEEDFWKLFINAMGFVNAAMVCLICD